MEDGQIIKLFQQRSEAAISELSCKYDVLCQKMAKNILNNSEDGEECVNDAYLAVWNTVPPQQPRSLRNYLCGILRNLALKKYHYNRAEKRNSSFDLALEELGNLFSTRDMPEHFLSAKELGQYLNEFLEELDTETRHMFLLRYWYGDSVSSVAGKFGMKRNTVTVRLLRTREKLKGYLTRKGVVL